MKTEDVEVKMKGQVVATVTVPTYETLEEVLDALEEAQVLNLVNRQNKSDITNKARADKREKSVGKGKRYETAINILATLTFENGETGLDRLNACIALGPGAKDAMDKLLNSDEVQAAVDDALADVEEVSTDVE